MCSQFMLGGPFGGGFLSSSLFSCGSSVFRYAQLLLYALFLPFQFAC